MKIDNKKKIKIRTNILIFFLSVILLLTTVQYIMIQFDKVSLGFFLFGLFIILIVYLFQNLLSLRCFDYEHSGEVISIKYYHPWKIGMIRPSIELPKKQLQSFDILQKGRKSKLRISVSGSREKRFFFTYTMIDLSKEQVEKIQISLQNK